MNIHLEEALLKAYKEKNALIKKYAKGLINHLLPEYEHLLLIDISIDNRDGEFSLSVTFFDVERKNKAITVYAFYDDDKIGEITNYLEKLLKNKNTTLEEVDEDLGRSLVKQPFKHQ